MLNQAFWIGCPGEVGDLFIVRMILVLLEMVCDSLIILLRLNMAIWEVVCIV